MLIIENINHSVNSLSISWPRSLTSLFNSSCLLLHSSLLRCSFSFSLVYELLVILRKSQIFAFSHVGKKYLPK